MKDNERNTIINNIRQLIADNNLTMVPIEAVNMLLDGIEYYETLLDLKDKRIAHNEAAIKALLRDDK